MSLSRWTAHEQWNITFILLKTRREEGHLQLRIILICGKGVGMIRVDFGPISETVYIDIILNTIIER
jgi:hypothetical protein